MRICVNLKATCTAALMMLLMSGGLLTGCATSSSPASDASGSSGAGKQAASEQQATRTVSDSDGNEVAIPFEVERVAPTMGAFAQVTEMLGQGNGKIAAASTQQISDAFKAVFTDYEKTNPSNYSSQSVEDLIAAQVQVVYGPTSMYSDEQLAQLEEAGIAVVKLAKLGTADGLCECILTIGEILGEDEAKTAQEFVEYYKASMADAKVRTADIPEAERRTVLQMSIDGGMYTCTDDKDISAAYYDAAGAVNVAAGYGAASGQSDTVDAEQIVAWNPDVIIAMNAQAKDAILADQALAGVTAVQNGDVYTCPTALYLWCVRSAEGALMTPWLGTVIYPEQFSDVDMTQVLQDFYRDWYNAELSDADAAEILAGNTKLPLA